MDRFVSAVLTLAVVATPRAGLGQGADRIGSLRADGPRSISRLASAPPIVYVAVLAKRVRAELKLTWPLDEHESSLYPARVRLRLSPDGQLAEPAVLIDPSPSPAFDRALLRALRRFEPGGTTLFPVPWDDALYRRAVTLGVVVPVWSGQRVRPAHRP